jgi:hypothetical protein
MCPVGGGAVMIPALDIANAEIDRLVGTFGGLPGSFAAMYGSGLTEVLRDRGLQTSPYERWFVADDGVIESALAMFCSSNSTPRPVVRPARRTWLSPTLNAVTR